MQSSIQDLRYALRQLVRNPGFAAVAILTLALGIGANTAIFSVVDSILLQPLPFPQAGKLVELVDTRDAQPDYNYPKGWIREYQRRATTFSSISAYTLNAEYNVAGAGASDRAFGSSVSTNLFDTLGVRPALGRFFLQPEEEPGRDRVVVLSHGDWQQHFGGDPNVIGKNILLDGADRQIIGVAPKGIQFPDPETQFLDADLLQGRRHSRSLGGLRLPRHRAPERWSPAEPCPGRIALLSHPDAHPLSVDYARQLGGERDRRSDAPGGRRRHPSQAAAVAGSGRAGAADRLRQCRESRCSPAPPRASGRWPCAAR